MSLPSLSLKVDEVHALLGKVQNSFLHLPTEQQNLVSNTLEQIASQLMGCLPQNGSQHEPPKTLPVDSNNGETLFKKPNKSEQWLRHALRNSQSGAWKWDLTNNIMEWSPELYELLHLSSGEDVSDPQVFFTMIHPDDRNKMVAEIDEKIRRGGPFYTEFRFQNSEGKTMWLSSAGTVEHDSTGKPLQVAGLCQDISEHKQMEAALSLSEERERARAEELQALMDAVPAMIWISRDPECREMVGNRYGYEFLKMWEGANVSKSAPDEERSLQPYRNFKDGLEIPPDELPMQIAASTGIGTTDYEFDLVFNNGMTRNLLGNVLPLTDKNGEPSGAVGAFIDITGRKQAENELRKSEFRFHLALAAAPLAFFTTDRDLRYTWFYGPNFNLTQEQVYGKRDDEIFHSSIAAKLMKLKQSVIDSEKPIHQEIQINSNDIWYHFIISLDLIRDQRGQVSGLVGTARNITEQRRLEYIQKENEIRVATQARLLKVREDERGKIARDIHDGPLQTLVGMTINLQILKEKISNRSLKAQLDPIRLGMQDSIHELRTVIYELRPPTLLHGSLVIAIQDHINQICEAFPGIEFTIDLDENVDDVAEQSGVALYRICQEAIHNIIRHAKATKVTIHLERVNDQVLLSIEDNGVGFFVPDDSLKQVAHKHYGLVGMKERAEAAGGALQITSQPGAGTKIVAKIPFKLHEVILS